MGSRLRGRSAAVVATGSIALVVAAMCQPAQADETISAMVPIAAAAASDGLPALLHPGTVHSSSLTVVVAGQQRNGRVSVAADDGAVGGCADVAVPDGRPTHLSCAVTPHRWGILRLVVTITTDSGSVSRSYAHLVL